MLFSPVFANFDPRPPILGSAGNVPAGGEAVSWRVSAIPFRMNTCKSVSKQITSTPFRINTYEKQGGEGALWLTKYPVRIFVLSERSESKDLPSAFPHFDISNCPFAIVMVLATLLVVSAQAALAQTPPTTPTLAPSSKQSTAQPPARRVDSPDSPLAEPRSLLQQGRVNDADRAVRQFLAEHPDSGEAHFLLGQILFREIQAGARSETQVEGVKVLQANPGDEKLKAEKAKASLAEFTAGAKYRDPDASDLKTVALDYVLLGDYLDADKWLTKMLGWTPNDSEGWYLLGRAKYNENRFAEAISAFQQCLKLDSGNVKAEDNLGLSYAGLGRNDEAVTAYQQAIAWQAHAPLKNPGPYIDLGDLLIDQNRLEDAVVCLLQAIDIAPRDSRAHELMGKAYAHLDQLPKAQVELEKAVELSPQSANLHCVLAPVYRKQGLMEKAKSEYDRCAALTGNHSTPEMPRP